MRIRRVLVTSVAAASLSIGALVPVALASATAATTQQDISVAGLPVVNQCNGDNFVLVGGDLHFVLHATENAAGGSLVSGVVNSQDVQGVDAQGNYYREQSVATQGQVFGPLSGEAATGTTAVRMVSQGSAPNLEVYLVFHVTLTPDGYEVSSVENGYATCQG